MIARHRVDFEIETPDGTLRGEITCWDTNIPSKTNYVMHHRPDGSFFAGQLNKMSDGNWYLRDSVFTPYKDLLVQKLEEYYSKRNLGK